MESETIKTKFPDLINTTAFRNPNYEVINFQNFINRFFGIESAFLTGDQSQEIRIKLNIKKWNEQTCFKAYGYLHEASFISLRYYQKEVGIAGPKHCTIEEPVFILLIKDSLILWNGYHRALINILNGQKSIMGYILPLD
jgi:hypothetical protein